MKKFFTTLCIFIFFNTYTLASIHSIDLEFTNCLKGLTGNIPMANCTYKATKNAEHEILQILQNNRSSNQTFNQNQSLWESYKNSTNKNINLPLEQSVGTMYLLFSQNNRYSVNKNRLLILDYILEKKSYQKEKYLSNELEICLKKSNTETEITQCYNLESKKYSAFIQNSLKELNILMTKSQYEDLEKNQNEWLKYKTNTENLLNKSVSPIQKVQIIKILNEERYGQLSSLEEIYKYK